MPVTEMMPLHEWSQPPGVVTTWQPTTAALDAARAAVTSPVPPSYQQRQHIQSYARFEALGLPMTRLLTVCWQEPGTCDTRAMTRAIDAHVLRHDTYASRFVVGADDDVERRVINDRTQIRFEPVARGEMTWEDWRGSLLDTPGPLEWDCFRFHVVQYADHFTFCASIDHLNADGTFMMPVFADIHDAYAAAVAGRPLPVKAPSASYLDYCERQVARVRPLTATSDEVQGWIEFLRPPDQSATVSLPVGAVSASTTSTLSTHPLMDAATADAFQQACIDSGNRLVGGVLAVVARAWTEVAGTGTFRAITPTMTAEDHGGREYLGWFTGVVPLTLAVAGSTTEEVMAAAQKAFSSARRSGLIPPEAVHALVGADGAPGVADWSAPMISLADFTRTSLTSENRARWQAHDGRVLLNDGASHQVGLWFTRNASGATLTMALPDTPEARRCGERLARRVSELCHEVATTSGRSDGGD